MKLSGVKRWLYAGVAVIVLALSLSLTVLRPAFLRYAPQDVTLSIGVSEERNERSFGREVRIINIIVDGEYLNLKDIAKNAEGWSIMQGLLFAADAENTAPLELRFNQINDIRISFFAQEGSGIVEINDGKEIERVDLYQKTGWVRKDWYKSVGKLWVPWHRLGLLCGWAIVFFVFASVLLVKKEAIAARARLIYKILLPIMCVASLMILAVSFGSQWETNDDSTISLLLSRNNNSYCPFIGGILSGVLHSVYMEFQGIDWWLILQYAGIALGVLAILYVLCNLYAIYMSFVIGFLVCAMTWITALDTMNFTRSSAILGIGGSVLIADALLFRKKPLRKTWPEYILGFLMLLLAQQIRNSSIWIALMGLAVCSLAEMILEGFSLSWKMIKKWIVKAGLLFAVVAALLVSAVIDSLFVTETEREYLDYNELRSGIVDYSARYSNYKENGKNLTYEDLNTFSNWYSEDMDVFTPEVLQNTIQSGRRLSMDDMFEKLKIIVENEMFLVGIVLCILLYLVNCKRYDARHCLSAVIPLAGGGLFTLYLIWEGRLPDRVYQPICYSLMIAYLLIAGGRADEGMRQSGEYRWGSLQMRRTTLITVCLTIWAASIYPDADHVRVGRRPGEDMGAWRENELLEYINAHEEKVFFFPISGEYVSLADSCSIWETIPQDYCENLFYLGGWTARIPYKVEMLAARGIDNPTRALLEKDEVYTTNSVYTTEHLRRHYGEHITRSGVMEVADTMLIQYTAPISDSDVSLESVSVEKMDIWEMEMDGETGWVLSGKLSEGIQERTLFCNVSIEGVRYSYRILADINGEFLTFLYDIPKGIDYHQSDIAFYMKKA